ncbi:anti-sigma factor [Bradyrhizobium sp. U87765 SZCCT0131]|uniref:anti-sigma factor family protein n=1 Tax=unclassified Bradyrhizobium TaxID=2631580 RepID=UPI001BACE75D|nr:MULTISPECIES: anti-sigma factor [unclassified Bradyrhizobium]MBR1217908.1 anti-sigma factor [Bradyrhizobium sp. U87765 SZCCT0131]MBR1261146.1 anti-sigma factor [Bradyrhizobium sp. U87765 SZCCT0134]MBR1303406.1 anti-sigma factor [Bradyrhizobium sp. U87765 SZCCT0110]MBR1319012.1 anti-sigma factor [Bradyrhizobium sp. U87765 SZCCT0109]MBR1347337.1 anti-sigma factor [Bradyrhizobium sp. U87765 SZCCT0048]
MTDRDIPVTEDELHAFVDNELPAERSQAVQAWLAAHPDDADRVDTWRALGEALQQRYGSVADEPVPPRLDLERLAARPRRLVWGAIAAVLLAFVVGSGAGWMARNAWANEMKPIDALRNEAITAHRLYTGEVRHPIEVSGSEDHLLPWLSRRVGTTLRAPDLTKFNLKLLGGRLLPGITAPAALFMYESPTGERVTLYCTPLKAPTTALIYRESGNTASVQWTQDDFGWVISGPANNDRLKTVAAAAYAELETR